MSDLKWNSAGERVFEVGVDRGVLYVPGSPGVPWNGLISVTESPTGGTVTPYYADGIKYLNLVAAEEFEAEIEAYTYPDEFEACDGTLDVGNGLQASQQRRQSFGFSYRTLVGNDLDGVKKGYKIHLVYNATAAPSERGYESLTDEWEPLNFSWEVTTVPPEVGGMNPTAHFVIDSRKAPPILLIHIENILYGSVYAPSRLPEVNELVEMFQNYDPNSIDAGELGDLYLHTIDSGELSDQQNQTIDAGGP